MSDEALIALINIIPSVLWFVLAAFFLWKFLPIIRDELLPRLSKFEAFDVTFDFEQELERAIEQRQKRVSKDDRSKLMHRAMRVAPVVQGARLLWVDMRPEHNVTEQRILKLLRISVDQALSTDEGLRLLARHRYEVLVSDTTDDSPENAQQLRSRARLSGHTMPIILYVSDLEKEQGTPPHVFAICTRPDELLHYIFDALERERS